MGSRKERKAQTFKKGAEARKEEKEKKSLMKVTKAPKKKAPPRFLLFVGNLPYNCTEEDINGHFEKAKPSSIRLRPDKGIAFLEFTGDEASATMYNAMRFHHSLFKGRKINVELSAGGGGNSANRLEKIRVKNDALQVELAERIAQEKTTKQATKKATVKKFNNTDNSDPAPAATKDNKFIHPSRIQQIGAAQSKH